MREVTKAEFKEMYFRLGGGPASGWTQDYWDHNIEPRATPDMKFVVEDPPTPEHNRMFIVTDAREHRLFFMTEESEESFFEMPGRD
jgi:hypothetical protein